MAHGKFVAYYRVSTQKQGQSGLGIEAQRAAVETYLNGGGWQLVDEFTEVETGKGADALDRRPQLRAALALCKKVKATLVIAKLDRLARNVHFVSGLIETGVEFVAADIPQANKTMIQMFAVMSEWERDAISKRTKEALAAAKARGIKLGAAGAGNLRPSLEKRQADADAFAENLRGLISAYQARDLSQRGILEELNRLEVKSPRGGSWSLQTVQRLIARLAANAPVARRSPKRRKAA
jgi:DNA invertase Pin-like site-specific DNA recombinase